MWERISPIREAITTMPFIAALADGSLPWPNFSFYLHQDALYLREYARSLARVAALAPEQDAQIFFARASAGALEAELSLHRALLADDRSGASALGAPTAGVDGSAVRASPVTAGYTDHLNRVCAGGDYPEAVAAVLPCFWLYQHIGELLAGRAAIYSGSGPHPYAAWIDTYADPAFAELTEQAIALTDRAAVASSALQRTAMATAFERSSQYEWMFFAQGTDLPDWPV
jgi:hydroxymethylpyrimidine/phosphomethylpyrimidine kinase/hydroxymethylpyrimidine kinase/phosphomethylpyrimidine kinase/thiamine-phosphate diphosphorylase